MNGSTRRITTGIRFEEISESETTMPCCNRIKCPRTGPASFLEDFFYRFDAMHFHPLLLIVHLFPPPSFADRAVSFPSSRCPSCCCPCYAAPSSPSASSTSTGRPTPSASGSPPTRTLCGTTTGSGPTSLRRYGSTLSYSPPRTTYCRASTSKRWRKRNKLAYCTCVLKLSLFRWRWFGSGYSEWKLWTGLSKSFASSGLKRLPELLCTVVTFFYLRVPVNDVSEESLSVLGKRRRRRRAEPDGEEDFFDSGDDDIFGDDFDRNFRDFDPSVGEYYPRPYCDIVQGE